MYEWIKIKSQYPLRLYFSIFNFKPTKKGTAGEKTSSNLRKTQDQTEHCRADHKYDSLVTSGIIPRTKIIYIPVSHQWLISAQLSIHIS